MGSEGASGRKGETAMGRMGDTAIQRVAHRETWMGLNNIH